MIRQATTVRIKANLLLTYGIARDTIIKDFCREQTGQKRATDQIESIECLIAGF